MRTSFLIAALALALVGCALALEDATPKLDCETLRRHPSFLNPSLCLTQEEAAQLGSRGRAWRQKQAGAAVEFEPVILIPGLAGSNLEVRLSKDSKPPHNYCYHEHNWYQTWLALLSMFPGEQDCWWHNLEVVYNSTTDMFENPVGIECRAMDFGGMKGVDFLDRDPFGNGISQTAYFAPLIKDLVEAGFKVGHNLFGAPYDWRKGDRPEGFYTQLQQLVEKAYATAGNKQVHIVAHSMGNIHTGIFLSKMSQAWKDKFIGSFISVAGPWSGAPVALRTVLSGNNLGATILGINLIDPLKVRKIARQNGGIIWMMPDIEFWNTTELVKTSDGGSWNAETLPQLFEKLGTPITTHIYNDMAKLSDIPAPNVELHCLYGTDFPTEAHFTYKHGFDKDPEITYSQEGDGTVPASSLRKCQQFATQQKQPVEVKEFDLANHMNILYDEELLQYILKLVSIVPGAPKAASRRA